MLLDASTPDTSMYMIAGYAIFFVITVIYLASLLVRSRNLHRDLETLETMEREADDPLPQAVAPAAQRKAKAAPARSRKAQPPRKKAARKR